MPQKKNRKRSLRPVRILGAEALTVIRGGADFSFTTKVDKSSPG